MRKIGTEIETTIPLTRRLDRVPPPCARARYVRRIMVEEDKNRNQNNNPSHPDRNQQATEVQGIAWQTRQKV